MTTTNTIKQDRVTVMITPRDKRKGPSCYDLNTPTLLGRFLSDNQHNPRGTLSFVRGTELAWVQQVIKQVEEGYDFWERV